MVLFLRESRRGVCLYAFIQCKDSWMKYAMKLFLRTPM